MSEVLTFLLPIVKFKIGFLHVMFYMQSIGNVGTLAYVDTLPLQYLRQRTLATNMD